jgi:AcrR family transcriptional regulator
MSEPTIPPAPPAPASRNRLIEAAARVYACAGFRGATTRRIAEEAGVNEVTIFRLFGSKAALIDAAVREHTGADAAPIVALPAEPAAPEAELTAWCEARLATLRERRSFILQSMGELAERPEAAPCAAQGTGHAAGELKRYMRKLYEGGFVEDASHRPEGRDEEAHAAGAMLMAALFGDAMNRDLMPEMYPQPAERAAALYVRLFLRAIRCAPDRPRG